MKPSISRRDFLKIAGLFSLGHALPQYMTIPAARTQVSDGDNFLIILFDAWSASHISLYGYERQTTPHLERLADRAIVYHNHYAGGHYTPPGTASLLTGTLPWTHRAFDFNSSIEPSMQDKNIFQIFNQYHRMAYTHNPVANRLLRQLMPYIDDYISWEALYLETDPLINDIFLDDHDIASIGWKRALDRVENGFAYSVYLSRIYEVYKRNRIAKIRKSMPEFPRGTPRYDSLSFFTLEQGIDWLFNQAGLVPQPFLGYYHFFPPHDPYLTHVDFFDTFANDGYAPVRKPNHFLKGRIKPESLDEQRRWYDEFILYVDAEFARLHQLLEQAGILKNTWIILTSDHGEMFERGIMGHTTPVFYQPIAHIPLVIFPPGATYRVDIYQNTSVVDILPTLSALSGKRIPDWAEGTVLPPFAETTSEGDISSVQVELVNNKGNIKISTAMIVRHNLKLVWYLGYEGIKTGSEQVELYDIAADPEETHNIYPDQKEMADPLLSILRTKLAELGRSYSK